MPKEIEIKSLLTKERYEELKITLPQKFQKINHDAITTIRFKPKDIQVRYSDKLNELVFKDGDPTHFSRKEITINLKDKEDCYQMISLLKELGFKDDPSWIKHKEEFILDYAGNEYTLSLQHIEKFAYILEAEIMLKEDEIKTENYGNEEKRKNELEKELAHIENLKKIFTSLGCIPIEPREFNEKIRQYIQKNSS